MLEDFIAQYAPSADRATPRAAPTRPTARPAARPPDGQVGSACMPCQPRPPPTTPPTHRCRRPIQCPHVPAPANPCLPAQLDRRRGDGHPRPPRAAGAFRRARIAHLGRPGPLETLEGLELADEQVVDCSPDGASLRGLWRLAGQIRRGEYELGVLLPNSFRSALAARLGGVDALAGYARDGRGWLLNVRLDPPRDERGRLAARLGRGLLPRAGRHLGARCDSRQNDPGRAAKRRPGRGDAAGGGAS